MVKFDDDLTAYLLRACPGRTDEALMGRFGISYNTFRKIEAGHPIRRSLAERLEGRLLRELSSSVEDLVRAA